MRPSPRCPVAGPRTGPEEHACVPPVPLRVLDGRRDALREHLQQAGIPAMITTPCALHLQKAYEGYGIRRGDLPVTEELMEQVLSLPMSTELDHEQLAHHRHGEGILPMNTMGAHSART